MKTWLAKLAIGCSLLVATAGVAWAQSTEAAAADKAAAPPAAQSMSNI